MIYIPTESLISAQLDEAKCNQLLQIKVDLITHKKTMAASPRVVLTLAEMQQIIQITFDRWLQQNEECQLSVTLPSGTVVEVDIKKDGGMFNCGFGDREYGIRNADLEALEAWVPQAIKAHKNVAQLLPPKVVRGTQQVNVCLRASVMFNFHIWLW